ncbi:cytochrome P450 protein [Candida orthopsilosis Co 90-125]|uniref:Cytochrome P450 protein n=1 Tax=Candida orthopsilosis (strain 90-125) TaxID=1136231 RepID=H8WZ79_CANO9|nr:cytochrome P450 protein [Candida orthopsilosis Co 90-125]CCG21747.1 cytochrome P450 protein [Candida orthopsilosis Co 90-125]
MLKDTLETIHSVIQAHPFWSLFVILAILCFYNLIYLPITSPFWKLPGSYIYRVSYIGALNRQREGTWIQTVYKLHQKYGPVVVLSPNEISVYGPQYVNDIYVKNFPKSSFYANFTNHGHDNIFASLNNEEHLKYKKIIMRLYNKGNVMSPENNTRKVMIDSTRKLLSYVYKSSITGKQPDLANVSPKLNPHAKGHREQWFNKSKRTKNLGIEVFSLFGAFAMDVISKFELGQTNGSDLLDSPSDREIILKHRQVSSMLFWTTLMPALWDVAATKTIMKCANDVSQFRMSLYNFAEKHLSRNGKNLTTLEALKQNGLKGARAYSFLSDNLFAGHETTAVQLCYLIYELSRPGNTSLVKRLQSELYEAFGKPTSYEEVIEDLDQVDKLPFLDALLLENSRVHSSIPGAEPRVVDREYSVGGVHIPKGTTISCLPYALHRDPVVFPKHDYFIPDRWLKYPDESQEEFQQRTKTQNKYMMHFGKGIRMCLGMHLAWIEMKLLVANLYWHFHSSLDEDWCEIKNDLEPILLGVSNSGKTSNDQEMMCMSDAYTTTGPVNEECWIRWSENEVSELPCTS